MTSVRVTRPLVFKYVTYVYGRRQIPRPRVKVRLSNETHQIYLSMLVDSGADTSFIPLEAAEALQIKLGAITTARSVSGVFTIRSGEVTAEIVKGTLTVPLGKIPVDVQAEKTQDKTFPHTALLGRTGLFTKFDVTFMENAGIFVLESPKTRYDKN